MTKVENDAQELVINILRENFGQEIPDDRIAKTVREIVEAIPPFHRTDEEIASQEALCQ